MRRERKEGNRGNDEWIELVVEWKEPAKNQTIPETLQFEACLAGPETLTSEGYGIALEGTDIVAPVAG